MSRLLLALAALSSSGCASFFSGPTRVEYNVVYKTFADAKPLKADVYYPKTPGPHPGVVVFHGGAWIARSGRMETICKKLARAGFVAFNATYRLAPETHFPDSVEDARDAIRFFQANADRFGVDRERISGWGYSAGSNMLLLAAVDGSLGLKAIVAGGAPTDLTAWPKSSLVEEFIGVSYEKNPAAWREASPVNHITDKTPPLFLYHGFLDDLVDIDQLGRIERVLLEKHRPYKTYVSKYFGHFSMYLFSSEADRQALDFLEENSASSGLVGKK